MNKRNKKSNQQEKVIFRPQDVQMLLGLGKSQIYELFHRDDFPSKRHGRSLFVSQEAFYIWLNGSVKEKTDE